MRECDNSKIHKSNNFLLSICLPIMLDTLCREKIQLDTTQWFIELIILSTCFGHYYAHHQELEIIQVITTCGT